MNSTFSFDVSEAEFNEQVIEASHQRPILVDFWATWCQPCQTLKPLLEKIAHEYQGKFHLVKVNTEEEQNLATHFAIRSIPSVKLFVNGEIVDQFDGVMSETDIKKFLNQHISRDSDALIVQAETLLAQGQADEALNLVKKANQMDPENTRALIAYALICATMGNLEEAKTVIDAMSPEDQANPQIVAVKAQMEFDAITQEGDSIDSLLSKIESTPDDLDARYQLAAHRMMKGEITEALDQLLLIIQKDRNYKDDAARKMILKIFDTLGDDPIISIYRRKMMNLFY